MCVGIGIRREKQFIFLFLVYLIFTSTSSVKTTVDSLSFSDYKKRGGGFRFDLHSV